MKKKMIRPKLSLKKAVVTGLTDSGTIKGGVEREPSRYSCMTDCWCPYPTNWTIYCCGGPGSFVCPQWP